MDSVYRDAKPTRAMTRLGGSVRSCLAVIGSVSGVRDGG